MKHCRRYSPFGPEDGHPRYDAVHSLKVEELSQWKGQNDYHQRALTNVKAMNKVIILSMPESYQIG